MPESREQILAHYSSLLIKEEIKQAIDSAISSKKLHYRIGKHLSEESFNENTKGIDWMEGINIDEVLSSASEIKHRKIAEELAVKEKEDARKRIIEKHNALFFFAMIKEYFETNFGVFIQNDSNKLLIKAVCYFMAGDERFETELNYTFRKGLLIMGTVGLGKTKIIKAVCKNEIRPISINSILDITERVKDKGDFDFAYYNQMILIDDIGSESIVNYYGNQVNWFKDFIEKYYLHHDENFSRLIITTNCGGDEIQAKYGIRVRDRMKEMLNTIKIEGPSLRN